MNDNLLLSSFPPIIDRNCTKLILGSMPGVDSLRKNQYYGHTRNAFWRIIFELFDTQYSDDYDVKTQFVLTKNIAIWDVIARCNRKGSLDSNIKNELANDFTSLYKKYPNIKKVYFNGTKAYETYRKRVGFDSDHQYIKLPSTSPAHAVKIEIKLSKWSVII